MLARRDTTRFAVRVFILLGLMIAPWPGVARAYEAVFRTVCNTVLGSLGSHGMVEFRREENANTAWDGVIIFRPLSRMAGWDRGYDSRLWGYLPTVTLIALVMASPISWSRRWRALALALALVHLFIALRIEATVLDSFVAISDRSSSWLGRAAMTVAQHALAASGVTSIVVPAGIWILVVFRREDWIAEP